MGLEFPLARLKGVGFKVPIVVSTIEIALMFLISYGIGWILGWSFMDSLFLGAALASSSTVIIAKVLGDMRKLKETSTLVIMGILIAEDLFVVLVLSLMTAIVGSGSLSFPDLAWTASKVLLFILGALIIGTLTVPKIIDRMAGSNHSEILVLTALGLCFGLSVVANMLGISMAIGAFLMGVLIAEAKSAHKVASLSSPIKDMFAAMFFVSMGALIDISQFRVFLIPGLIVTAIMIVGKIVGCGVGTKILGYDTSTALKVGLGMGQIGEFAFIVAKVGLDLKVISPAIFPTIGIAAAITAFLTPYMIRLSYGIDPTRWLAWLKLAK